ncbi:protein FAR1-RELATED SEQUENCE 5-like [Arachis ipaensis]|uniref:protein FAR1-RELATED SEQUENCE 5-like n=1 Tax=Arachis ipaensis TaxID=130454 RepID=UPI0007AF4A13|nr:protein FAR1-RELATED SEQUENCE 5-like [Arachis ipaensis]XP_016185909.1 protein FAR1-RELATED SEQUENCE 5-like [Arachis ipaensis]
MRTNCEAKLSIYFDKTERCWKVWKVVTELNHDLTPASMVHLIANHREMTDATKAQIDGLHASGIATSKIVGYMAGMASRYSLLGFLKKDVYNYADRIRRANISDGDANAAIVYLEGKAGSDPMSVARYSVTKEERLANLIWADGASRVDYQYFGDVLAFDSTYKKNKYKKPLVIFSGSNNHKQTTIFGFRLLFDESVTSYKSMLENLFEVMCKKKPSVVVTNGDKNVTSNVKDAVLRSSFRRWLYVDIEIEEFEMKWEHAVADYDLHGKEWATQMYERRRMWANAYLRDKFCAGFRTTSRCERINAFVKKFSKTTHTIIELVQNLELVVREYQNKELLLHFNSMNSIPVMTTGLTSIEQHATSVYTREVFTDVKKQIVRAAALILISKKRCLNTMVYTDEEYKLPAMRIKVAFGRSLEKIDCQCNFWRKNRYPCKHMFFVMKSEHVTAIPDALVL